MAYTPAHLAELGLSLWRTRGAGEADAEAAVRGEPMSAPAPGAPLEAQRRTVRSSDKPPAVEVANAEAKAQAGAQAEMQAEMQAETALREAQIMAMDWGALEDFVRGQQREGARQAVFGIGARDARLFVVGEAPGAEEDERGEPFVGRAGQLLDQMLGAIGLSRHQDVYIANVCKFRPPDNRDPSMQEIAQDLPLLRRQITLIQPRLLLAVGRIAAQSLLACKDPIGRLRGKQLCYADGDIALVATYHPAYLLRSPREKAKAWEDLKRARELLAELEGE